VGHSAASRVYANKEEFIDEVLAPFGPAFLNHRPVPTPVTIRRVSPTTELAKLAVRTTLVPENRMA
jgi:hypothetical protein